MVTEIPVDVRSLILGQIKPIEENEKELLIPCYCDEGRGNKAHLYVNKHKGLGYCVRCGRRYSPVDLVRLAYKCDYVQALSIINNLASPDVQLKQAEELLMPDVDEGNEVVEDHAVELPSSYRPIRHRNRVPTYLRQRQVDILACLQHNIGYCDGGFYNNRVIIPVYFLNGELATFVARWMDNDDKQIGPKVLYPKGSKKSHVLFNQRLASKCSTVFIVEGVFDALRAGPNAVALLGKHASNEQLRLLVKMGQKRRLIVLLDSDAKDDAEFLACELAEVCPEVYLGSLPEDVKDPGEASKKDIERVVRMARRIGRPFEYLQP